MATKKRDVFQKKEMYVVQDHFKLAETYAASQIISIPIPVP